MKSVTTMNKKHWFHIVFFIFLIQNIFAQSHRIPEVEEFLTEEVLLSDSISNSLVPVSNEHFSMKTLDDDFCSNYSGTEFQYEIREENSFLARLRDWWKRITDFFKRSNEGTGSIVFDEIVNILR